MVFRFILWFALIGLSGQAFAQELSDRQMKKVESMLESYLDLENLSIESLPLNLQEIDHIKGDPIQAYFRCSYGTRQYFLLFNQAPSMKQVFDYAILLNEKGEVEKVKVLIYREQHGRQIGSARWLKQFESYSIQAFQAIKSEVNGISGATISTNSMTAAIQKDLEFLANHWQQF